jgi:DNA-binding NtrC family response regulator
MNKTPYGTAVVAFKRELIATSLREHGGNRTHAARALGVPRTYLLRLIRQLSVSNTQPVQATPPVAEPR